MTTNEDILKAMAAEKHKIMSATVKPQMKPNLTDADIVAAHKAAINPGRGGQKIGADSKLGAPKPATDITKAPAVDFHIPGLKEMLKNDRR
jgi:hypothetical protein